MFVDDKEVGITPMETKELDEGRHVVKFVHDWFQPIERVIQVPSSSMDNAQLVVVDFCNGGVPAEGKTLPDGACGKTPTRTGEKGKDM